MSVAHPTLRQAETHLAYLESVLHSARSVEVTEDGFWAWRKGARYGNQYRWPVSDISKCCDDCGCILQYRRDAGAGGFSYNPLWLTGNPAQRDPTVRQYKLHAVCLSCWNRARPKVQRAQALNENRLLINRIIREAKRAA